MPPFVFFLYIEERPEEDKTWFLGMIFLLYIDVSQLKQNEE